MLLGLDLAPCAQAHPRQLRAHDLAQAQLGQQQEVVVGSSQHDERRDHARLRGEEQRGARLPERERLDVVRDHPLQVVRRVGPDDADELPPSRSHFHAD